MSIYDVWIELTSAFNKHEERKENMMDDLKSLFKREVALLQTTKISAAIINLLAEFNDANAASVNKKNAFIDCLISILEEEKTQIPPASK